METLAIVAYSQPVTRAEIEKIRGVSADNMIRLLLEKGFVKEAGKKDIPGRPVMYGTTKEFLKQFHLNSISELPKLADGDRERFELEGEKY
jgi:segregation and condensation protein B